MGRITGKERVQTSGPLQFRLIELFVCTTVAAVIFACIGRWGVGGTIDRLEAALTVAGVLAAFMEIHYRIKNNLGQ